MEDVEQGVGLHPQPEGKNPCGLVRVGLCAVIARLRQREHSGLVKLISGFLPLKSPKWPASSPLSNTW
jgi:hypothetical protein